MFKSSFISNNFIPSWFKKSSTSTQSNVVVVDPSTIPKNFTISNTDNKLINVSMNNVQHDDDEFIDIETKPLSYAEVASLGKNKKQTNMAKPSKGVINKNQFNVLNDKDINDNEDGEKNGHGGVMDIEINYQYDEPIKSGDEYNKSKSYKLKQQKSIHKKKQLHREFKAQKLKASS
ncbi:conserved hypothetical protein [Candida dubliniensis CD36]|uniref:Uncharacterized protein n=1 Tax=Candida dubliniensis (strain CD36 / ATCC MYA-646 / CBS 7987 / NCPF 3949 / NRRL Y-17841) TaxID=573826 RepID=B9W920_CANDC|nr:conserved hypothetical protein [Candida dubliniensis CD36]CAX45245.1 conserved hypothetical protein [Candida dubliniensis CD36]